MSVLCLSILNVRRIFCNTNEPAQKDIVLECEDILYKILNFLEYWRQKNGKKQNVVFLLKVLCNVLKIRPSSFELENNHTLTVQDRSFEKILHQKILICRQVQMNRLNAIKICLMLFWEEFEVDAFYLNCLLKYVNLLLQGGNKVVQKTVYEYFFSC